MLALCPARVLMAVGAERVELDGERGGRKTSVSSRNTSERPSGLRARLAATLEQHRVAVVVQPDRFDGDIRIRGNSM